MSDNPTNIYPMMVETPRQRPEGKENWNRCGDVWLRVADERDVLYADAVQVIGHFHETNIHRGIVKPSLGSGQKWFDGTKDEFFSIDIDLKNTVIEGYYEDSGAIVGEYEVIIYLEVEE